MYREPNRPQNNRDFGTYSELFPLVEKVYRYTPTYDHDSSH
jgi:hypothetical protein